MSNNTGDKNTGNGNTGNWNTGHRNTGHRNTGHRNTGNWNTGDWNTGDWNTGDWNTGDLNTNTPKYRIFNKETDIQREDVEFPVFFYFGLTKWISEETMTDNEKADHPTYKTMGGYLKKKDYQEAWRDSWDEADEEDRRKVLELPNWDNDIFLEISGIDVEKELNKPEKEIEVDGKKYSESTIKNALKEYVK